VNKRKSIKEQLISTTNNSKMEANEQLSRLSLNERIKKAEKVVKTEKTIRDAFTMQESDQVLLREVLKRCMSLGFSSNKSELVRAGIMLLTEATDRELCDILERLPKIKVGRVKTV
jgi:hypothetical protein